MRCILIALTLLASPPVLAQPSPQAIEQVGETVRGSIARDDSPGLSVHARWGENGVLSLQAGAADRRTGEPVSGQTRFLSGSTGKTITALLAVQLAREGVLDLDAPLDDQLPDQDWWTGLRNHDRITLRMLLNHSAGVPDYLEDANFFLARFGRGNRAFTPRDLVRFVATDSPEGEPGAHYAYSDTHFILVGLIIETVTGEEFYDLARTRIIAPLGMRATEPLRGRTFEDLAAGHVSGLFGSRAKVQNGRLNETLDHEWAAGGWVTTPQDLVTLYRSLGEDGRFADEGRIMRADYNAFEPGGPAGYGLGLFVRDTGNGHYRISHGGDFGGYRSAVLHDSASGITLATQANYKEFEAPDFNYELWQELAQ